jgi:hypothetical protein
MVRSVSCIKNVKIKEINMWIIIEWIEGSDAEVIKGDDDKAVVYTTEGEAIQYAQDNLAFSWRTVELI